MNEAIRVGKPYKEGELEIILSLVPTNNNIKWLAKLLDRSEGAIRIVYKIAYEKGKFGTTADIQGKKIFETKKRLCIEIGGKNKKG